jgi:hypothetical protein
VLLLMISLLKPLQAEEKYTELKQGEPAPYAGILLTREAIAKVYADQEAIIAKLEIENNTSLEQQSLSSKIRYDLLDTKYKLNKEMYKNMITNRDNVIKNLPVHRQTIKTDWGFVGGFILGAGITVGVVYSIDKITNE